MPPSINKLKKKHKRNIITYLHQFMDVSIDEFMRGDGRQAFQFVVRDDIVCMAQSSSRVIPYTHPHSTFTFGMSKWRGNNCHFQRRSWRKGAVWIGGRTLVSTFSSLNFLLFESKVRLAKGSFFKFLIQAYLSLLYLVAISAKRKGGRERERSNS